MSLLFRIVTAVGLLLLATRHLCHCHDAGNSEPNLVYLKLTAWPLDSNKPFNGSNDNTVIFDPFSWAWASPVVGRTLLTYPFDYDIISLGTLAIGVETWEERIPWSTLVNSSMELTTLTANQFIRLTLQYLLTTAPGISGSLCHQYESETFDWYKSLFGFLAVYSSPLRINSIRYRCYGADRTNVCFSALSESQQIDRIGVDVCVQNSAEDLYDREHTVMYYGLVCFAICLYTFPLMLLFVKGEKTSQEIQVEFKKFRPGLNPYSFRSLMSRAFDISVLHNPVCRCIVYSILVLLLPAVDCLLLFTSKYHEISLRYNNNIDVSNYYNFMFSSTEVIVSFVLLTFFGTFLIAISIRWVFHGKNIKQALCKSFPCLTVEAVNEIKTIGYDLEKTNQATIYALANRLMLPFSPTAWAVIIGSCLSKCNMVDLSDEGDNAIKKILKYIWFAILAPFLVLFYFIPCVFFMFASAIPIWVSAMYHRFKELNGRHCGQTEHFILCSCLVVSLFTPFLIIPCYIKPVTITLVLLVDIITFTLCRGFPIHSATILPAMSIAIASGAYISKFWIEFSREYAAIGKTIVRVSKQIDDTLNNGSGDSNNTGVSQATGSGSNNTNVGQTTGSGSNNANVSQATSAETLNHKDNVSEYVQRELYFYVIRKRFPVPGRFFVFLGKVAVTTTFLTVAISTLVNIETETVLLPQGGSLLAFVLAGLMPHLISFFANEADQLAEINRAKLVEEGIQLYREDNNTHENESFCTLVWKHRLSKNTTVSDGNMVESTSLMNLRCHRN